MSDPILDARIRALDDSLRALEASVDVFKALYAEEWQAPNLWKKVGDAIETSVGDCDAQLNEAREKLAASDGATAGDDADPLREAWRLYATAQASSETLFQSCLEFIGGVAFRGRLDTYTEPQWDEVYRRIWIVADKLMYEAAGDSLAESWDFLTVPALEDAMSESLTRTVRMRFPEGSIWTLSLLAYDLGLVAIPNRRVLRAWPLAELVETQGARLAEEANAQDRDGTKRWQNYVRVLLADAFATTTMGPAYACAAIHLRFDPSLAYSGTPCYDERARVVLWALRRLASETAGRYDGFIETLSAAWRSAVERAEPVDRRDVAHTGLVDEADDPLLTAFDTQLTSSVPSTGRYSAPQWLRADAIASTWREELKKRKPLSRGTDAVKLREVLNAAWLCRIDSPGSEDKVAPAALDACFELLESQLAEATGTDRRGGFRGPLQSAASR